MQSNIKLYFRGKPRPEILPFGTGCEKVNELQGQETGSITARRGTAKSDGDYIVESNGETQIKMIQKSDREIARIYNPEGIASTLHLKTGGWQEPKIAQALQSDGMLRHGSSFGTNNPQSSRNIRRLTPTECERLQGFPDGWTSEGINEKGEIVKISDTQRYKMCGNAVTVNVIREISKRLNGITN